MYFVMHQNDSEILYLSLLVKLEDVQQIVQSKYVSDMSLSKCNGFKFSSVEFTKTKPKLKNKIWVQNAADVTENKILLRQNTFKLPQSVISSIRKELVFVQFYCNIKVTKIRMGLAHNQKKRPSSG